MSVENQGKPARSEQGTVALAKKTSVSSDGSPVPSKKEKAQGAFRTISEVADELDIQQHVLRFWETKFSQVRPLKRGGGRRYYRPEDVALLKKIHHLLYTEGYTIKGVQKLLKEKGRVQILQEGLMGNQAPPLNENMPSSAMRTVQTPVLAEVPVSPSQIVAAVPTVRAQVRGSVNMSSNTPPKMGEKQRALLQAALADLKALRAFVLCE